jgi:hypothetical protein
MTLFGVTLYLLAALHVQDTLCQDVHAMGPAPARMAHAILTCAAPCTSMSSTQCLPAALTCATAARLVPYLVLQTHSNGPDTTVRATQTGPAQLLGVKLRKNLSLRPHTCGVHQTFANRSAHTQACLKRRHVKARLTCCRARLRAPGTCRPPPVLTWTRAQ